MFVITDTSARSVRSAGRVHQLVESIKSDVKNIYLVLTKSQNEAEDVKALQEEIRKTGLNLVGVMPFDPLVANFDLLSKPLFDLPDDSGGCTGGKRHL